MSYPTSDTQRVFDKKDFYTILVAAMLPSYDIPVAPSATWFSTNIDAHEEEINQLLNSPEFSSFVATTKEKFLRNPDKYPSMTNADWK